MEDVKILKEETTPEGVKIIYVQPCSAVCCKQIAIAAKDGVILEAHFAGGCPGNTVGVASLVRGMKMEDAIARLEGIKCGGKSTSCPDQMARALKCLK